MLFNGTGGLGDGFDGGVHADGFTADGWLIAGDQVREIVLILFRCEEGGVTGLHSQVLEDGLFYFLG